MIACSRPSSTGSRHRAYCIVNGQAEMWHHQAHEPRKRVHCIKDKACAGIRPWDTGQDKKNEIYRSIHSPAVAATSRTSSQAVLCLFFSSKSLTLSSVEFVVGHLAWLPMQWIGLDRRYCDCATRGCSLASARCRRPKYICRI